MGGCTLTVIRDTREEALEYIKNQILRAERTGLYPDSALVVLQEGAEEAELYRVYYDNDLSGKWPVVTGVRLEEIEEGRVFHVGAAARYNRPLKPGEWVATVHVHS